MAKDEEVDGVTLKPLRFLQFSDAHLDSPLYSTRLRYPPEKRQRLRQEMMAALEKIPDLVQRHNVEVVLCPGDLWEDECVQMDTAVELFRILGSLNVPVLIAPGNHDYYHPMSYYSRDYYRDRTGHSLPEHVYIFTSAEPKSLQIPGWRNDVVFHGSCYVRNSEDGSHPSFSVSVDDPEKLHVALVHGSLLDFPNGNEEAPEAGEAVSFSTADILASPFDYVALGHYHRYQDVTDAKGRIRAAYSGIPVARGLDETRDHFILVGTVEKHGVDRSQLRHLRVDPHRILEIDGFVEGEVLTHQDLVREIVRILDDWGVTPKDIVFVRLQGLVHRNFNIREFDPTPLSGRCWHIAVDLEGLEPDYDLDAILKDAASGKTVIGQFVQRMNELEREAKESGDLERLAVVREARRIGLDVLHEKGVRLPYALG